ncbi:hypothetical protein ACFLXU_01465, partial [Chloroflexota bacterium]
LFSELQGRVNLGEGVLDFATKDVSRLLTINLTADFADDKFKEQILGYFNKLASRNVRSIFEELGFPKPNKDFSNIDAQQVSLSKVLSDRRELDKVVFGALGLTESEQIEIYKAVIELIKNRLFKARSA